MGDLSNMLAQCKVEDNDPAVTACVMAPEAERMIEQLQAFSLADVGSPRWHTQREWISRLNLQAHTNAGTHSDEFIVELLVSLDKMKFIVHDLLVIETWKLHVLPHLRRHLAQKVDLSFTYLVLYHESVLANLLELTLYHTHACESLPEETLLELVDWCARKLTYLVSPTGRAQADVKDRTPQELLSLSPDDELIDKEQEVDFSTAMCAVTIIRYLSDNVIHLPMGLMGRLLSTNDVPMALVALLENPPWVRRKAKGRLEKWSNNTWLVVEPADRFKLTQTDAQVWLTLNNLIVEPKCRAKYSPDEWRRDKLLTLKRYMNELLFDQLPVLKDLQRTLDEMALGVGPDSASARSAALVIEAVPNIRSALLRGVPDGRVLALEQARTYFSQEEARRTAMSHYETLMKQLDFLVDLQPHAPTHVKEDKQRSAQDGVRQLPGPLKVSCWRKAHDSGVFESWCDYQLALDPAKPPEPVALEHLHGLRFRLLPIGSKSNRPLPSNGKVVVHLGGGEGGSDTSGGTSGRAPIIAEALLQLPDIPVKSLVGENPPVVWVNMGVLAEDKMVLQLKLKRTDTGQERDKVSGVWYVYWPVGGALTVLRDWVEPPAPIQVSSAKQEKFVPAVGLLGITGSGGVSSSLISAVDTRPAVRASSGRGGAAQQATLKSSAAAGPPVAQAGALSNKTQPDTQIKQAALAGLQASSLNVKVMQPTASVIPPYVSGDAEQYDSMDLPD